MGCCCSKPVSRAREEETVGESRFRALLRRLRPGGYSQLVETLEFASHDDGDLLVSEQPTSSASHLKAEDAETRQLRENLESKIEQLQNRISELEKLEQSEEVCTRISELQASISELTDSQSRAERELSQLQQQHNEVTAILKQREEEQTSCHSRIGQLEVQISELTVSRFGAESELESLQQKQEKMAATLQQRDQEAARYRETQVSNVTDHDTQPTVERELETVTIQRSEAEAALRVQISELQLQVSGLTESRLQAEQDLEALKLRHSETEDRYRSQVSQLEEQITELTESRLQAQEKLEALKLQQNEAETTLRNQVALQREQISQLESSLTASEEGRSQSERALAQVRGQLQRNALEDVRGLQTPPKPVTLKALVNEVIEVTDWFHFGIYLDIPYYELANISSAFPDGAHRKTHMLIRWMQLNENPSWSAIVVALVNIRMRCLAQRVAKKYGVTMPHLDETIFTQEGVSHSQGSQFVKAQLLAGIQSICERLEKQEEQLNKINSSLEVARNIQQTATENDLSAKEAVENGQMRIESLTEGVNLIADQLRARNCDFSFLQELHHHHVKENEQLQLTIEARKEEIDNLKRSLREREIALKKAQDEVKVLADQLWQARRELEASCSRVQELERERAEIQAEVNRERREVDHTLIQTAATFPTQESAQEIEYQHDQAMEVLSGLEVTCRQEDSQTELPVKARKLESLRLTWRKCRPYAPQPLSRGSAVIDTDRHTAYFSDDSNVYAYEWQREKWFKLPSCPNLNHTLVIVGGLLTAVGGGQYGKYTDTLLSLVGEGKNRKWEERYPPMPTARGWTSVVCSGKHLMVIGGTGDGGSAVATVEVMDTETRQWITATRLLFPLSMAAATIVGDNVYLLGGSDRGQGRTSKVLTCSLTALLLSCHQPDPLQQSPWQQVANTPSYRSTCVTLNGELVSVGGCDAELNPTYTIYAYNPVTDSWKAISYMSKARRRCLAVVLPEDRLMVVGGYTSMSSQCAIVEVGTLVYYKCL